MLTNAGPTIVVRTRTRGTRVSSSLSKIPDGEFSSVRVTVKNKMSACMLVNYRALPMAARVGPSPTGDLPLGARDRAEARALRHES